MGAGPRKGPRKGGEAGLHPADTTWGRQSDIREAGGVALGLGKCMDPDFKLPGSTCPEVPTASLHPPPLRIGLAGPLGWSSRSDGPFEYEPMPGSPGGCELMPALLIYIHICTHSQT